MKINIELQLDKVGDEYVLYANTFKYGIYKENGKWQYHTYFKSGRWSSCDCNAKSIKECVEAILYVNQVDAK